MPQYQSQLGQMGFKKQTAAGSAATLAAAAPTRWLKIKSSTVGPDRTLMIPDPEIQGAGGRDIPKPYLGPATFSGDYDFYARSEALPLALYGALGGGGAVPTGTALLGYTHTFTTADTLPYFTIQEQLGSGFDVFQYVDAQFNSLHLEAAADGYVSGKLGVAALAQTAGVTPTATPGFDGTPLLVGTNTTVTLNAASVNAASFSFDMNNNLEFNHFVLGSLVPDGITPKRREITGNITLRPQSNALFRQAMYGNSSATAITGNVTVQQMIITATTYEIISGATSALYTTTITLPEVILKPFKPTVNQDDVMEHSIDFQVAKIAAANSVTITVQNGQSTAYNV